MSDQKYIKVRAEEVAIGALVGVGTMLAVTSPVTLGLPSLIPSVQGNLFAVVQAGLFWLSIVFGGGVGGYFAARQERDSHMRGARYVANYRDARTALQVAQTEQFSVAQRKHEVSGVNIGGVEIARAQETRHIVIVGTTGSGKTALLTSVIDQVLARGDRIILHDPKGDYTAKYYDPKTTVLLGPWDSRAHMWDAASDISTPALADEFGAAAAGKGAAQNQSFHDNAARVISATIKSYMRNGNGWNWSDLAKQFAADPGDLAQFAERGDPGVVSAIPSAFRAGVEIKISNGDGSTLSIVASSTKWIANYAACERSDAPRFSIVKWLLRTAHEDVNVVIMNSNAQYQSAAESIFGSVLSTAVAVVNSAQMPERSPDAAPGIWTVLDELPQLGESAMQAMQKIYELGRSRGIRAVLAMQSESQLAAILGREKAAPMLSVQGAKIYMQCSSETADDVSKRVGEREINRIETTSENGALSGKVKKLVTQKVIQPSDLMGLHPRIAQPPLGVELILHINDTLGRLLHPFSPRRADRAPALIESDQWKYGVLPGYQPHADDPQGDDDDTDDTNPLPVDDDDLPGGLDDADDADDDEATEDYSDLIDL